jgi:short subunit fatty acids transporter
MRQKIYNVIQKIYGILMTVSFFAGILPIIPYGIALVIGGETGQAIAEFLYNDYYKWVILGASVSVLIGLIGLYVSGEEGLSVKSVGKKKEKKT